MSRAAAALLCLGAALAGGCATAGPGEPLPAREIADPTLLLPGVVSTDGFDDLFATFTPDLRSLYFVRRPPGGTYAIYASHFGADGWSAPEVASFSGRFKDQAPFVSPGGERLYFYSNRPADGDAAREDDDLWVVEATADGWSVPRRLPAPVNGDASDRHPTVDVVGNLVFWSNRPGGLGATDVYRAPKTADGWGEPVNLGAPVNTDAYEAHAWISPDGDLLLFSAEGRPDGLGGEDVYVSRREGERWSTPRNLGSQVNSPAYDFAPRLTPDGRFLVFSSNRERDGAAEDARLDVYVISVSALEPPL